MVTETIRVGLDVLSGVRSAEDAATIVEYRRLPRKRKPKNFAFILDANGRWAEEHGVSIASGHENGSKAVESLVRTFSKEKMNIFLWGFSTDNWKRPEQEQDEIFQTINSAVKSLLPELKKKNGRLIWYGREEPLYDHTNDKLLIPKLPDYLIETLKNAQEQTKENTGNIIGIAANYSGEDEQRRIMDRIRFAQHTYRFDKPITRDVLHQFADDGGAMGDFDLVIRTGGDQRTSGLGWRTDYSQLYFTDTKLPDFRKVDAMKAIIWCTKQDKRYGGRPATV